MRLCVLERMLCMYECVFTVALINAHSGCYLIIKVMSI